MNRLQRWLKPLAVTGLLAMSLATFNLASQSDEAQEGFDRQSEEEIAQADAKIARDFAGAVSVASIDKSTEDEILARYAYVDPNREVPTDLLKNAILYFDANLSRFPNQAWVTIVDFKPRSNRQRLFLIDMASGAVEKYRTTHGIGSDRNKDGYAERFSNVVNSGTSSLGFVRTGEVYHGKFRRSLRLDGLSSTNSNIRRRAIVYHGWDNVYERDVVQGLSWGCITMDWALKDAVIDKIRDGSLMYVGVAQ